MRKIISLPIPQLDSNVHRLVYAVACILRDAGATVESARKALYGWRDTSTFRPGRFVPNSELEEALSDTYRQPRQAFGTNTPRTPKWPKPDPEKRRSLIDPDFTLRDLIALSPHKFSDTKPHTREILEALFPGDPLMSCGWKIRSRRTLKLSAWKQLEEMQFIVPSPMSSEHGERKKDGALSGRTLSNTGARRFLVIDYDDHAGADIHASASMYLEQKYPLALVLHSGGKSLHAWYYVDGVSDDELRPFMAHACELGGDHALWTRSQFCRMPDGERDNGKRQTVYYFNPEVVK